MNIGIAKFGTIIDETNGLNNSTGHMLEIFNLVDILSKEHNVFITNNLRKPIHFKQWNNEQLDFLIVFNGGMGINNTTKFGKKTLSMLERYTYPVIETINGLTCPYIYIQPDIRYRITETIPSELKRRPNKTITLLGDENYFGLDKLWLYKREIHKQKEKGITFGLMYNNTNPRKTKTILQYINILKQIGIKTELKGNIKADENTGVLLEKDYHSFLQELKYTVNMASNDLQITPRVWDCFLNGVIAFTSSFDKNCKVIPKDSFLRINGEFDLYNKIEELEKDEKKYNELLEFQYSQIKDEYLDGTFILNAFNKLFKELEGGEKI